MQICKQCEYQFSPVSIRFYCCDKKEPVCITCRRDVCKQCRQSRTLELLAPKCQKCYSRLYQNDLLLEYNCGKYFCAKCLSSIFRNVYKQVVIQKIHDQKNYEIFVKLACGHQCPYNDLLAYFQHFCIQCGRSYDITLDYQLSDGAKLCFFCYKFSQQRYKEAFIKCIGCDSILQNSLKAQLANNQGMVLCKLCVNQSKIQQEAIQQSRKPIPIIQTKPPNMKVLQQQKTQSLLPDTTTTKNRQTNQPQKHPGSNPLNKFLKKPSITELKEKQSQRQSNNNSSTFSITSKFSNEMDEVDEHVKQQLGLTCSIKMKKRLSGETMVESFNVQIDRGAGQGRERCVVCACKVEGRMCYGASYKGQKKGYVAADIRHTQGVQNQIFGEGKAGQYICRVCYYRSTQRQKYNFEAKSSVHSNKARQTTNRPSRIQPIQSGMDYLKVSSSPRRQPYHHSPSPSPNKQYTLTGSKHSSSNSKHSSSNSKHSSSNSPLSDPYPSTSPLIPVTIIPQNMPQSIPQPKKHAPSPIQVQTCKVCQLPKKTLIMTLRQGHVCDDCYYRKNTHAYISR